MSTATRPTPRRCAARERCVARTSGLERALGAMLGGGRDTVRIAERRPLAYRSTFPLEELRVRLGDGRERWLVFKDLSRDGPTASAWAAKPAFLRDPRREIAVYRELLAPARLSAPALVGALSDAARGRHWLFLERVEGAPLWQRGERFVWNDAAAWLGELHARYAGRAERLPTRLLRHDAASHQRWLARAGRFAPWPGGAARKRRELPWLASRAHAAAAWLERQPVTLLHGEFYPSNVLVEPGRDGCRIRPLDWEMAGVGPGLLDLAALSSGVWSEADRAALRQAYRAALPPPLRPDDDALRAGLDRCRLLLAVQWLGWSPRWRPPAQHAHDWLATALELAARLPASAGAGSLAMEE